MTVIKLAAVLRSSKGEMNCVEAEWRIVFEDKSLFPMRKSVPSD